jgi:hypothetical protein
MIQSVQEMGKVIIGARPITKDADSVTAFTDEFVQDVRREGGNEGEGRRETKY